MPFQPGQSGNPGGRPKERDEVKQLARQHGPEAVERLLDWMRGDNPKASVSAANAILDRGYGKPVQAIEANVTGRDVTDWTRDELVAFLNDATNGGAGTSEADGSDGKPDRVH